MIIIKKKIKNSYYRKYVKNIINNEEKWYLLVKVIAGIINTEQVS